MSKRPTLAIATKSNTPASLTVWLTLKQARLDFDEVVIDTTAKDARAKILEVSPSGRLPCLVDDGLHVHETVAICEYVADMYASTFWPTSRPTRAHARSVAMEAHNAFADLRRVCPMNFKLEPTFGLTLPPAIGSDVLRAAAIWRECRDRYGAGGPFLFGHFTIADALFAPIASIFGTYGIPADDRGNPYLEAMLSLPLVDEYKRAARAE